MAYRDCPCLNCKDRSHGSKRVACQTGCEKYLSWKAIRQKKKEDKDKYYSTTKGKFYKRNLMKQKGGRKIW